MQPFFVPCSLEFSRIPLCFIRITDIP